MTIKLTDLESNSANISFPKTSRFLLYQETRACRNRQQRGRRGRSENASNQSRWKEVCNGLTLVKIIPLEIHTHAPQKTELRLVSDHILAHFSHLQLPFDCDENGYSRTLLPDNP
jgi:hypothetical protein